MTQDSPWRRAILACSSALSTLHCCLSASKRCHSNCKKCRIPGMEYCCTCWPGRGGPGTPGCPAVIGGCCCWLEGCPCSWRSLFWSCNWRCACPCSDALGWVAVEESGASGGGIVTQMKNQQQQRRRRPRGRRGPLPFTFVVVVMTSVCAQSPIGDSFLRWKRLLIDFKLLQGRKYDYNY